MSEPEDQPKDPKWHAADAEAQEQVKKFEARIRNACRYQFQDQRLSAQVITAILLDVAAEVAGEWWADEIEEVFEALEAEDDEDEPEEFGGG